MSLLFTPAEKITPGDLFWVSVEFENTTHDVAVEVLSIKNYVAEIVFVGSESCCWIKKEKLLIKRYR